MFGASEDIVLLGGCCFDMLFFFCYSSDGEEDSVSEDISLLTSTSAKVRGPNTTEFLHLSLSLSLSLCVCVCVCVQMETEDVSIFSQNSLTGDYDHAEPVQT